VEEDVNSLFIVLMSVTRPHGVVRVEC
jgi:hypothetical protein